MRRKNKYTKEVKLQAILDYDKGKKSIIQLCNELDCAHTSIWDWMHGYRSQGEDFFDNKTNKAYTEKLKLTVIKGYLLKKDSSYYLAKKYRTHSKLIVLNLVSKYNKGMGIKDYNPKPEVYKTKARKTTFEERVEIAKYCINNYDGFKGTVDKYNTPYSLVYQFIR